MKKIFLNILTASILLFTFSCKKADIRPLADLATGSEAQVKFFNFGINSPSLNFYGNDAKIAATLSTTGAESATGIAYGSVFLSGNYSLLAPGAYKFTGVIPSTATTNSGVTVSTVSSTLESGKYYSLYTCGFYDATAKTTDSFVINDAIPGFDNTKAYVRFVNTIPNATAGISLYIKNTVVANSPEVLAATSVAYKAGSAFVAIDAGIYELYGRYASAPTVNLVARNGTTVVTMLQGHVYTVSSRGDITVSSTGTATNRPFLDFSTNR